MRIAEVREYNRRMSVTCIACIPHTVAYYWLYRPLMLALVGWFAVFAPMVCEYHGLMMNMGSTGKMAMDMKPMPADCDMQPMPMADSVMESPKQPLPPGSMAFRSGGHKMLTDDMQSMSLMVSITPQQGIILPLRDWVRILPANRLKLNQPDLIPPESPPRLHI